VSHCTITKDAKDEVAIQLRWTDEEGAEIRGARPHKPAAGSAGRTRVIGSKLRVSPAITGRPSQLHPRPFVDGCMPAQPGTNSVVPRKIGKLADWLGLLHSTYVRHVFSRIGGEEQRSTAKF